MWLLKDFEVETLLQDLVKVFNFKKEMLLEIDLDNYQDSTMINNLLGSAKGYIGYEQGGILSEHIIKYPFGVVYFKNYHNVHYSIKSVLDKLMQKPFFYDNKGRKINLQNTIFIIENNNQTLKIGFNQNNKVKETNRITLPTIKIKPDNSCYNKLIEKYHIDKNLIKTDSPEETERIIYSFPF